MLHTTEQMQDETGGAAERALVTGDLGTVVVRALLENGVGYVVSSWRDRPTPIDAAIDDARERVLAPHGVVLRRLRSLSSLAPLVARPEGGVTGAPPRGAVVFAGRHGMRPALEQFVAIESAGAVVGFCFDADAARIPNALVIDPEPTAIGIVRAIDAAFDASLAAGRPALVLIRPRALGMRGTVRSRVARTPVDAADADARQRAATDHVGVAEAAEAAGLVDVIAGNGSRGESAPVVVAVGPLAQAVERALAELASRMPDTPVAAFADRVAIVATTAVGIASDLASAAPEAARRLRAAESVLVLGPAAVATAERLALVTGGSVAGSPVDPGTVRGEELVSVLAGWTAATMGAELDEDAGARLDVVCRTDVTAAIPVTLDGRVPRRGELLHRAVSPVVAAGMALAQGVIGVPGRIDPAWPTYRTDGGVALSVVPAAVFAEHGAASAAPNSGHGVFLICDGVVGVPEAAGAIGASIEYVDGSSPRAIGRAVALAARAPRVAPHVIVVSEVQRVAAPRSARFGMDPELVGTERIAAATLPATATTVVDLGDDLLAGPAVLALDTSDAHAVLQPLRELTPATWDLRHDAHTTRSWTRRTAWSMRRRLVKLVAGVDL